MAEGTSTSACRKFHEVLWEELKRLRPRLAGDPKASAPDIRSLYRRIGEEGEPLAGLCLSGGGIRSATFNLGVIQGLARLGLLGRFDYLSSVSGGGYIAGWLRTWMAREGRDAVLAKLAKTPAQQEADPLRPEPAPVRHLREYSNYLTPRLGLMSADTWAVAAIISRNLLLNWLVIVPLLAAAVCIPQFWLLIVRSQGLDTHFEVNTAMGITLATALFASVSTHYLRRFGKDPSKKRTQLTYVFWSVLPLLLSAVLLAATAIWIKVPWRDGTVGPDRWRDLFFGFAVLWCVGIPLLGWAASAFLPDRRRDSAGNPEPRPSRLGELLALIGSGLCSAAVLAWVTYGWFQSLVERPTLYAIFAVPILLGVYLLGRALFVAFVNPAGARHTVDKSTVQDPDREWWARLSGWILLCCLGATALCLISLGGGWALEKLHNWLPGALAAVGGVSGLLVKLLGGSGGTSGKEKEAGGSRLQELVLAVAAPVFIICLLIFLSQGTAWLCDRWLGTDLNQSSAAFTGPGQTGAGLSLGEAASFLLIPGGALALAFLMGLVVNVNRFSMQGLYRNRLVRAYLGASNPSRRADPFTGFDANDNLAMWELWKDGFAEKPLPVINCSLNLVSASSERLAWQERKAESFSITPFYCGNYDLGYRDSHQYGGPAGISVGTAVSISGAAANPNMGFHSSPTLAFLMTLFNARLGAWLGNPGEKGETTFRKTGPKQAIRPLLSELFGMSTDKSPYVSLSDGGHFENLGIYEMVLRRCRFLVVCDAASDPTVAFGDLGNAIRKVRIDFGVPIEFEKKVQILSRDKEGVGTYCATAFIRYSAVDGTPPERDGYLIYIKPALSAGMPPDPLDVYSYARISETFPHETTADQWFSESQFESYRALGRFLISLVSQGDAPFNNLDEFREAVESYLDKRGGSVG
jgi:hypothetical protein